MKRTTALALALLCLLSVPAHAAVPAEVTAPSAILMEKTTGTVLCEQDAQTQYEPASVTKIMTLLLVMEAIDSGALGWDDLVTASPHAISMGGSQIWLKENEQMTVHDMVKAVTVASANDCAVALAEHVAGSEAAFVERMNARARELGMGHTTFKNCTGLPEEGHLTCAYDIALMSRELIVSHPEIREFTTIWMDTLRDGMELIAVVMHAPTSNDRFDSCKALLNYGFANYAITPIYPDQAIPPVEVLLGERDTVQPVTARECSILLEKSKTGTVTTQMELSPQVEAPVEPGQKLGELRVLVDGEQVDAIDLIASEEVPRLSVFGIFKRFLNTLFLQDG